MRTYTIIHGKHAGEYTIYNDEEEFYKYFPDGKLHIWGKGEPNQWQTGDWVRTSDGYVVQIISIRWFRGKKNPEPRNFYFLFPMGTAIVYRRIKGDWRFYNFYAQFTSGDRYSLSGTTTLCREDKNTEALRRFARLIINSNLSLQKIYVLVYSAKRKATNAQQLYRIDRLLRNPIVREELMKGTQSLNDILKSEYPMDSIKDMVKKHIDSCKPGTKQYLENIQFLLKLHQYDGKSSKELNEGRRGIPDEMTGKEPD